MGGGSTQHHQHSQDRGAFGFDGLMEGVEGSHMFDLPPLWEEPPLSGSSPLSNWWDTSPGALSSASWDSGIGFGGFAGDIQSPTPVGVHAGVFPRSGEGEGEQPRQHRTPSPRGEQEGGSGGNAFIPHTDRTTSYGYPYYPIIGDGNGGINPQFLQRIGLCYDPRTTPETSHATQQQRAKTPAYQGPNFEPEEEKFRPQSVPPQTTHTHGFSPRSPLVKERPPSVKPQIALDRRNFSPKSGAQTPQPTTDGWYITSTPESFKQQVSPPAIQRRKKQFVTESPGSRAKGQGNWMNESDDQSDIRQMFKRDYKPPEKPWDTDSLNYDEIGWLAKMRTSCHGPVTYAWCLTIIILGRNKC
ncbi:hypothetical protein SCHPADRAFT_71491 [Schizopora paradoxa]|uniref:Uncharacterized protein n=1 Tax=Schizopora paradoxa TaxID=27342 RepID=A0A0H2SC66_9AGAM|nr:hypothetical protein SCHPADRAFT_71491 [Schizopora paradoxa]